MFPMEFDHTILDSLPLPTDADIKRVIKILEVIVSKRVLPYFRSKRGTDPIVCARVGEAIVIERLEDYENRVRCVSLISHDKNRWTVHIHERVFDYLAFVIPSDPQARLGAGSAEEHKMLAFSEFLLRHQIEHMIYPDRSEREAIQWDITFAMDQRSEDPTFYRMLRRSLEDEMNGLDGGLFLQLFEEAEREEDFERHIPAVLNSYVFVLGDLPDSLIVKVFPHLDTELKTKVLGVCYRRSRDTGFSLLRRTFFIHRLLRLFDLLVNRDDQEAESVFRAFRDRWGLVYLLHELDLPEASVDERNVQEIFQLFKKSLKNFSSEAKEIFESVPQAGPVIPPPQTKPTATPKTLKDRIESVRNDPLVPLQVMEVIDKNKLNTAGQSGYKYNELIETLLAIPWGKIKKIDVSPREFEEGLDRTHYGLHKPKEVICDFFANLIWRYNQFREDQAPNWHRNGSAFLFVGPPGVGKTSLAISIAENLGIPYHKLSLGGMRDEADLRGHGFTYEGSKPGAIVQGIVKMGVMNGMFIMDEADKTEKFAIATLLEILDPEQNHLFHDKYTQTTVDIDLSNFHFVLTANTLEPVPPPVVNRCELVLLDRYSMDEKVEIARKHLIKRVRERHEIAQEQVFIDPRDEEEILSYLIKSYTHEAGVRELERIIRTLFLRIMRKEILTLRTDSVHVTREKVKEYLEPPTPSRTVNDEDRIGEMMGLGINVEMGIGSLVPIQATSVRLDPTTKGQQVFLSMIHATGNIQRIMDESRKVATTAILYCRDQLGISLEKAQPTIHLHFMGGSTPKDGPSAGGAIALALASVLSGKEIRRDVAMTGEIDTQGRITRIGGVDVKLETAVDAGCKTVIIPEENLHGEDGVENLSEALKREYQILNYDQWKADHKPFNHDKHVLQIVAVNSILQAAQIAFIDQEELAALEKIFAGYATVVAQALARERGVARQHLRVMYIKGPEELELATRNGEAIPWEERGCIFLIQAAAKKAVAEKYPELEKQGKLWELDPTRRDVTRLLQKIAEGIRITDSQPGLSTFVAPFFYLKRVKSSLAEFSPGAGFKLKVFANNYTVQGIKIKACKAILNQAYCFLSQLDEDLLEQCPFLKKRAGIRVVDLSFIPEKYRLDVRRAEKIVNRVLTNWLAEVEDALLDHEDGQKAIRGE